MAPKITLLFSILSIALLGGQAGQAQPVPSEKAVTLIVTATPKPESYNAYVERLTRYFTEARKDSGNLFLYPHLSADNTKVYIYESWRSQSAIESHQQTQLFQKFARDIGPMLAAPPVVDFVTNISGPDYRRSLAGMDPTPHYILGALTVTEAGIEPFERNLNTYVDGTRSEAGNKIFEVLKSLNQPGQYYAYEVFQSERAFATHGQAAHTQTFVQSFAEHLTAPPVPNPVQLVLPSTAQLAPCLESDAALLACRYIATMNAIATSNSDSHRQALRQDLSDLFDDDVIFNGAAAQINLEPGRYRRLTGEDLSQIEEGNLEATASAALTDFLFGYAVNTPARFVGKSLVSGTHLASDRVIVNYEIVVKGQPNWKIAIAEHVSTSTDAAGVRKIVRIDLVTRIEPPQP